VIVQKRVQDNSVEEMVARLGGKVTTDLSIINGFAAEIMAKNVLALAQADGVRSVSWDAPVEKTDCSDCTTTGKLTNTYIKAINADKLWPQKIQGQGIGVAVVDSGINWQTDLYTYQGINRVVANVAFNNGYNQTAMDAFGHGSHVAGVIGGNGRSSSGLYIGVAPQSNIINVKVNDDTKGGSGTAKSVVQGLQWILQNKKQYNIRVVNISINSVAAESYQTSPIDAAVEVLWFNGIVVVVSAGNSGSGTVYPPANDPFVITVGAVDDKGTTALSDDTLASFSAYGKTTDGVNKPDLVAPGKNIIGLMGNGNGMPFAHPDNIVRVNGAAVYFRMSGTSTSAPMVAGAVALLLQKQPNLKPDQVKYRLMTTANKNWAGYNATRAGAGYLDVYAATQGTSTQSANTGTLISRFLFTGTNKTWNSANWDSANWDSANWDSANWDSANWDSVSWNSDYWGP
jgi:serine protease AprX